MSGTNDTLAKLIKRQLDGRSAGELEKDCGGAPSRSRIWQIQMNELKAWPTPEAVRGLATGLRVSEAAVIHAAANSLGFRIGAESRLAELLPAAAADLNDQQVNAVLAMVAAMNPDRASRD